MLRYFFLTKQGSPLSEKTRYYQQAVESLLDSDQKRALVRREDSGGLWELPDASAHRRVLNLASNDYLNLSHDSRLLEAVRGVSTTAAGSSRLLSGNLDYHLELESKLSGYLGGESALVFGAGYLANLAVLSALPSRNDVVFSDKLIHASAIDGIMLSRARHRRFRHNDTQHLESLLRDEQERISDGSKLFIVVESLYSMDGDFAPLSEISELAESFNAILVVDEAHAIGVIGPEGRGLVASLGLQERVDVITGTLSKALAAYGGFAVCRAHIREYLINSARPFIYNTALPPMQAVAASVALDLLCKNGTSGLCQNGTLGSQLLERAESMRKFLSDRGIPTLASASQIIPIPMPDAARAVLLASRMAERGILTPAIRAPTVPKGSERLRLSLTLAHTVSHLEEVADALAEEIDSISGKGT